MSVIVWLTLRRQGFTPTLDEAAEVFIRYGDLDPTSAAASMKSPAFAGSGDASPETLTP